MIPGTHRGANTSDSQGVKKFSSQEGEPHCIQLEDGGTILFDQIASDGSLAWGGSSRQAVQQKESSFEETLMGVKWSEPIEPNISVQK